MRRNVGALGPISPLNDPVPVPLLVAPREHWWAHCVWAFGGTVGNTGEAHGAMARFHGGSGNVHLPSATETVRFVQFFALLVRRECVCMYNPRNTICMVWVSLHTS